MSKVNLTIKVQAWRTHAHDVRIVRQVRRHVVGMRRKLGFRAFVLWSEPRLHLRPRTPAELKRNTLLWCVKMWLKFGYRRRVMQIASRFLDKAMRAERSALRQWRVLLRGSST